MSPLTLFLAKLLGAVLYHHGRGFGGARIGARPDRSSA